MLRALSKKLRGTRSDYPINWRYNARRYHPARPLPPTVAVEVSGRGWRLLSRALGLHLPPGRRAPAAARHAAAALTPCAPRCAAPLGTVRLVSLPADSATYYLVPGADSLRKGKN